MSAEYLVDDVRQLVVFLGPPPHDFEQWRGQVERALADPRTGSDYHFVSDRRAPGRPSPAGFIRVAVDYLTSHPAHFRGRRWAAVVADMAEYGMVRMAEEMTFSTGLEIKAFRDYDLALRWAAEGVPGEE